MVISDKANVLITSPFETPNICPNKISSMFKVVARLYLFNRIIPIAKNVEKIIPIAVSSPTDDLPKRLVIYFRRLCLFPIRVF